ncbi:MAG: 3-oxoacyl-ACP synthase [Bacteroidetes bacterium]|nr:3-oxoacyl-ACP synthase [Bacteroidota bacterium]
MNPTENFVTQHCRIRQNSISANGELIFQTRDVHFQDFADSCYRHFELGYPKFHKMDNLSKLGLLATDILLNNMQLSKKYAPYQIGVILSNRNSSLDTDIKYYNMVKKGVASPAVFVYSLPNIVIGEICIKQGIKGESTFFISDQYNIPQQVNYVNHLLETKVLDACICGWVELIEESYEAFFYLVEKNGGAGNKKHTTQQIEELYNK